MNFAAQPVTATDADTSTVRRLWERYAACWSADPMLRRTWLAQTVVPGLGYRDPGSETDGAETLADYMSSFAGAFPGHRFRIDLVTAHHDRSLAMWTQLDPAGHPVMKGLSVAVHDGTRFIDVTGFFLGTA